MSAIVCVPLKRKGQIHVMKIDYEDWERLKNFRWRIGKTGRVRADLYTQGSRSNLWIHRLIADCPKNLFVDHINGDPLDNRKSNLRLCTHSQNMKNQKRHKDSKNLYKGVYKTPSNKYYAKICCNGGLYWSSRFDTIEEAQQAYINLAIKHHREFARW